MVLRAQIIKGQAGATAKATASTLEIRRETAALWRRRVRSQGIGCGWEITGAATRKVGSAAEFSLFQSFDFTVF